MQQFIKKLISTRSMAVLFVIYIVAMASATFIENNYGTPTAKRLVYNAFWFEMLQFFLILNFVGNISRYNLLRREKWPVLVFHLSFIFLFIGGMISRYIGYEGVMRIREGQTQNIILSDKNFLKLQIEDSTQALAYRDVPTNFAYMPSYLNFLNTKFDAKYSFKEKAVVLRCLDFIPRAKDSIIENPNADLALHVVSTTEEGRQDLYFRKGEIREMNGILLGYEVKTPPPAMVNISESPKGLMIYSPIAAAYKVMATQKDGMLAADSLSPLQLRALYTIGNTQLVFPEKPKAADIQYFSGDKNKEKNLLDLALLELEYDGKKKPIKVYGGKNNTQMQMVQMANKNFFVGYGAKEILTEFAIRLNDFQLERYPGSANPSSYASEVSLIDDGKETDYRIYMNHVLDHKGYRFFQSSYDPDEQGTVLSVNHDFWGTTISYLGYAFLFIGLLLTLFWKGTHFWNLNTQLKKRSKKNTIWILFLLASVGMQAQEHQVSDNENYIKILQDSMHFDKKFTDEFGKLQVQNYEGRIMPMNTMALEVLRKLTKKEKFHSLDANQWMIAVNSLPSTFWIKVPMIKVGKEGGTKLKELTNANEEGYCRLVDLMRVDENKNFVYILEEDYNKAFRKKPFEQSKYDKEVIKLNERVYIMDNLLSRQFLRMIPIPNDPNSTWTCGIDNTKKVTDSVANSLINDYLGNAVFAIANIKSWEGTQEPLDAIKNYQKKWGANVILPDNKVNLEIFYNKANGFFVLMIVYSVLALLLLITGFAQYFTKNKTIKVIEKSALVVLFLAMLTHAGFLAMRWYISGHAPWSNGYEAVIFISLIGLLSGFLFYKNSNAFVPMAGCIIAVLLMGFAHGGDLLDPQITPLVPVLKSYWLMIHVAIITSSYGFFGMAAILGMLILFSFILTDDRNKSIIKHSTQEMKIVIEMSLTIGIALLTIGTFLGGIWANESWGRYWSWDPKETWAYISIIVYAFVLHMRLVPGLRGVFPFVCAAIIAFSSVVMTYFGVNYYLSGLHSYAAGDPLPIPSWVYISIAIVLTTIILSYNRYQKYFKKEKPKMATFEAEIQ